MNILEQISVYCTLLNALFILTYLGVNTYNRYKEDKYSSRFEALSDKIYELEKLVGIEL